VTCNPDTYARLWQWVADGFKWLVSEANGYLGNEQLAVLLVIVAMTPVALLFSYVAKIAVPAIAEWYYEETITRRALHLYQQNIGVGFRRSTAAIAITAGVVFYFLVRIAAAIPFKYLLCTLFGLVIAFAGVSILGFFVSGRVPASDRARQRYWKRFQSPTIAGLVLGVGTIVADFVINSVSILVSWL
jgi:hypothetical protein